jgi:hypothetical protein
VAKHTPELPQLIVNAGGVGALVDYVNEYEGNARLLGIMTLGYIPWAGAVALVDVVAYPRCASASEEPRLQGFKHSCDQCVRDCSVIDE